MNVLDREEYIEQAYFFRTLRERLLENMPTQEVLSHVHEEILSTTRLPMAIQFIRTELRHTGLLSSGFAKLPHYFAPFQSFVIQQIEDERMRFTLDIGLLILEREAVYRASEPTKAGLFVYQFESLSRNRLGYDEGIRAMFKDPFYDVEWRDFLEFTRRQLGVIDFADLVYLRSHSYLLEQTRLDSDYVTPVPVLFGEKEGRIAKANRGRDPLYLFAALQRQLGYPEVPRTKPRDTIEAQLIALKARIRELEARTKLLEGEVRGHLDLSEFMNKPELLHPPGDDD